MKSVLTSFQLIFVSKRLSAVVFLTVIPANAVFTHENVPIGRQVSRPEPVITVCVTFVDSVTDGFQIICIFASFNLLDFAVVQLEVNPRPPHINSDLMANFRRLQKRICTDASFTTLYMERL